MDTLISRFFLWKEKMDILEDKVTQEVYDACEKVYELSSELMTQGYSTVEDVYLPEVQARALVNLGRLNARYGMPEEAIEIYDRAYYEYRKHEEESVRYQAMRALVNSGVAYVALDESDQAIMAWDEAGELFHSDQSTRLQQAAMQALLNKAVLLDREKGDGAGFDTRKRVVELFKTNKDPHIQKEILKAIDKVIWPYAKEDDKLNLIYEFLYNPLPSSLPGGLREAYLKLDPQGKQRILKRALEEKYTPFLEVLSGEGSSQQIKGFYSWEQDACLAFLEWRGWNKEALQFAFKAEWPWGVDILNAMRKQGALSKTTSSILKSLESVFSDDPITYPTLSAWTLQNVVKSHLGHNSPIASWFFTGQGILTCDRLGEVLLWHWDREESLVLPRLPEAAQRIIVFEGTYFALTWHSKTLYSMTKEEESWVQTKIQGGHSFMLHQEKLFLLKNKGCVLLPEGEDFLGDRHLLAASHLEGEYVFTINGEALLFENNGFNYKKSLPHGPYKLIHRWGTGFIGLTIQGDLWLYGTQNKKLQSNLGWIDSIRLNEKENLISLLGKKGVRLFSIDDGRLLASRPGVSHGFSKKHYWVGEKEGSLSVFNLAGHYEKTLIGHTDWIVDLWLEKDFLYTIALDSSFRKWDLSNDSILRAWGRSTLYSLVYHQGHLYQVWEGGIRSLSDEGDNFGQLVGVLTAYLIDGDYTVLASHQGDLKVFYRGVLSWEEPLNLGISSLARKDSKLLVGLEDGMLLAFDLTQGRELFRAKEHREAITCMKVHPHEDILFTASEDRDIVLWNLRSGENFNRLAKHTRGITSLALAQNSDLLISGGEDGLILTWDWKSGSLAKIIKEDKTPVWELFYSEEQNILCAKFDDKDISLWSIPGGLVLQRLKGHRQSVNSIRFLPGESFMVTGGRDKSIRLWKLPEGRVVKRLSLPEGAVQSLAVNKEGSKMAVGTKDGFVKEYDLSPFSLYQLSLEEIIEGGLPLSIGDGLQNEETPPEIVELYKRFKTLAQ